MNELRRHHYHSNLNRALYSFLLVFSVTAFGTIGMHHLEKSSWVDAFYFMSMIATAQGSAITPVTTSGKLFAALMAFVSVGTVVVALGFLFGPFFGKLGKIGLEKFEDELKRMHRPK